MLGGCKSMTTIKNYIVIDFDNQVYELKDGRYWKLVSQQTAAEMLGLTLARVGQLVRDEKLEYVQIGSIKMVYLKSVHERIQLKPEFEKYINKSERGL